jgi:hypothetical protein
MGFISIEDINDIEVAFSRGALKKILGIGGIITAFQLVFYVSNYIVR